MYLEHFGLSEHPFKITPVTDFFFSGANRQEILDALIYSISEVEGITKVSGEVGSGKTMLCQMLLKKLPKHIEVIYLANPSLSRDEMLYAIADGLKLNVTGERVGLIMRDIQNCLVQKAREGKRVVVLVDEAHAMPLDTLEQLRLLYNLQVGKFKLLQLVLFGQPELNEKLEQPNMRQLKDRIVHHFNMQPLSLGILENYLMFRMRTAHYHGPNVFAAAAIKLMAKASNGLMRRANVLADKALLAAFIENTHYVEARHVEAAMRDSEIKPSRVMPDKKWLWAGGAATVLILLAIAAWGGFSDRPVPIAAIHAAPLAQVSPSSAAPVASNQAIRSEEIPTALMPAEIKTSPPSTPLKPQAPPVTSNSPANTASFATASGQAVAAPSHTVQPRNSDIPSAHLYEQRLKASVALLAQNKTSASIQLFYSDGNNSKKLNEFLLGAEKSGALNSIYLLPVQLGGKSGVRVLYGNYNSVDAARSAVKALPASYQENFAISIYSF